MDGAPQPHVSPETGLRHCDVMVIGGGPGGAAAASFLARAGLDVVIVEKDRHPRFHIGESLLPGSLPILDDLGVLEDVRRTGVRKPGAEFISEDGRQEAVFEFRRTLFDWPDHAYQVLRSDFDKLLYDRALALGASGLEDTSASVDRLEDDRALITTRSAEGTATRWQARFLIDASGRSTLVSRMLGEKHPDPHNDSAAIFGHFRGVPRQQGERAGNIRIHLTRPGWVWQIPLPGDVTSIGWVASSGHLSRREGGIDPFFHAHCNRHPHLASLLESAEPIEPLRATGNFSYRAETSAGTCHIKVGDAYGFIDPIFSTGVHLALTSAREAARTILAILDRPARRPQALAGYHRTIERRLRFVSWFIYRIHDPAFRYLMVNPRNILGIERAIISLLAADFRSDPRLRVRIAMFKLISYVFRKLGKRGGLENGG